MARHILRIDQVAYAVNSAHNESGADTANDDKLRSGIAHYMLTPIEAGVCCTHR